MKFLLIALLVLILVSLGEAMFYLVRDSGRRDRRRVVRALTARIGLSLFLFVLAMAGLQFGWLEG